MRAWVVALLGAACAANALPAHPAAIYEVRITSPALAGVPAALVFDFIDGGPPDNTITLGVPDTDGTIGGTVISGDVSGSGPWSFGNATFFSELAILFDDFGSSLVFRFTSTDLAAEAGGFPDAFSLFVLAPDLGSPLVTTDDPTGANALFVLSLGTGSEGLSVYASLLPGFAIDVVVSQLPEPGSIALVALAATLAALGRRMRRH